MFSSAPPAPRMVIPSCPEAGLACVISETGSQISLQPPQALWGRATTPPALWGHPGSPQGELGGEVGGDRGPIPPPPGSPGTLDQAQPGQQCPLTPLEDVVRFSFISPAFLHAFGGMLLTVSPELLSLLKWGWDSNVLWGEEPGLGLASTSHVHRDFPRDVREQRRCPLDKSLRLRAPTAPVQSGAPFSHRPPCLGPEPPPPGRSWNVGSPWSPLPWAPGPLPGLSLLP